VTRILYINPVGTNMYNSHLQSLLKQYKSPATTVEVRSLTLPPELTGPLLPVDPVYYNEIFETIRQAEQEGFDAAIIGCASDPALPEAQRMAHIPIIAPLQAAATVAAGRGKKLAVLYPDEHAWKHTLSWARSNLRLYGLETMVACIRFINMHTLGEEALLENNNVTLEHTLNHFRHVLEGPALEQAKKVLVDDATEMVFFGCTIWGGMLGNLTEKLGVPIIDPVIVSLRLAELQGRKFS